MNLAQLNQTMHDSLSHDILTAQRMYMDICRMADREDMQNQKVVFVGTRDSRLPQSAARGEVIGHSFFDFGITDIGITNRAVSLLNYLGMNAGSVSAKDYIAAIDAAKDKPCWPAADSVFKLDDCIVIKLSD